VLPTPATHFTPPEKTELKTLTVEKLLVVEPALSGVVPFLNYKCLSFISNRYLLGKKGTGMKALAKLLNSFPSTYGISYAYISVDKS
jgi:hypothetical protein